MFNPLNINQLGLDIYFHKCKRTEWDAYQEELKAYNEAPSEEQTDTTEYPGSDFDPEEVGYFRKVNFLMTFFDYTGNCEYKEISKYDVELLRENCDKVLADHSLAEELLPTASGFFFGSTEYSEWYFQDVAEVKSWAEDILASTDWDTEVVLMYCWW